MICPERHHLHALPRPLTKVSLAELGRHDDKVGLAHPIKHILRAIGCFVHRDQNIKLALKVLKRVRSTVGNMNGAAPGDLNPKLLKRGLRSKDRVVIPVVVPARKVLAFLREPRNTDCHSLKPDRTQIRFSDGFDASSCGGSEENHQPLSLPLEAVAVLALHSRKLRAERLAVESAALQLVGPRKSIPWDARRHRLSRPAGLLELCLVS